MLSKPLSVQAPMHRDSNIVQRENLPSETIPLERLSESVSYIFKPQVLTQKTVRAPLRVSVAVQTENSQPAQISTAVNTEYNQINQHSTAAEKNPSISHELAEKAKKLKAKQATFEAFLSDIRERNGREIPTTDYGKVKRMVALTNARHAALSPRINESGISFRPLMTPSPTNRRN